MREKMKSGSGISFDDGKIRIQIDEHIGEGSTCLVYAGRMVRKGERIEPLRVIVKEFYPDCLSADMHRRQWCEEGSKDINSELKTAVMTKESDLYKKRKRQFEAGYVNQIHLSGIDDIMEVVVRPLFLKTSGDSEYLICDIHSGVSLDRVKFKTLEDKLECAVRVVEMMGIFHEAGYMITDFKPENILWTEHPKTVRLIDVDSVIPYEQNGMSEDKNRIWENMRKESVFYYNTKYSSKRFRENFVESVQCRWVRMEAVAQTYLRPRENIYSLGIYIFELLFERMPEKEDLLLLQDQKGRKLLSEKILQMYSEQIDEASVVELLEVIGKAVSDSFLERYQNGYVMMEALNKIKKKLTSVAYLSKKEIAKANGTFAAYNLLQKKPLYNYMLRDMDLITRKSNLELEIGVTIYGSHLMRKEMLSAMLSIGQMPDVKLTIYLLAKDSVEFWERYLQENPGLHNAVIWYVNGIKKSAQIDKNLVSTALAEIHIWNIEIYQYAITLVNEDKSRYFVLMEEQTRHNIEMLEKLKKSVNIDRKILIAYIEEEGKGIEEDEPGNRGIDLFGISVEKFCEKYNEKMFEEKIYNMGFMAHAYYYGCMDEDSKLDINKLEQEFKTDLYSVMSSERSALHGIYKMASVGIRPEKPGRCLKFYRRIQNPQILEKLAWAEHISWTAYMLTTSAVGVNMSEFTGYAYQNGNDWKDKSNAEHLRHPLLVASHFDMIPSDKDWLNHISEKAVKELDPLDKVSYEIFCWYKKEKEEFHRKICAAFDMIERERPEEIQLIKELLSVSEECLNHMGERSVGQEKKWVTLWDYKWQQAKRELCKEGESRGVYKVEQVMKPVVDSYKDRDFKKMDRDIVYAVVDMMV